MNIYIPSSGRARDQHTWKQIPKNWQQDTAIVCPQDEYVEYCGYNPDATVIPCPHKGIGPTRQFILAASYPHPVCMLDDDLTFFKRRLDDRTKFSDADTWDVNAMLHHIEHHLKYYAAVGVCPREGGNRYPDHIYNNVRLLRVLAYDPIILATQGIEFTVTEVMEDFYVALSLLTRGYPNVMLSDWCHNQVGSNAAGGCSQYRTMEVQEMAAITLKTLFPDFVTLVKKQTKTAWGGQERTDVRVQWKKAYTSSGRTNGSLDKPQVDNLC
jgi:hypothetical protein